MDPEVSVQKMSGPPTNIVAEIWEQKRVQDDSPSNSRKTGTLASSCLMNTCVAICKITKYFLDVLMLALFRKLALGRSHI